MWSRWNSAATAISSAWSITVTRSEAETRPRDAGRVVAIVGPTAAGKTALSLELAEAVGGEIVSADSRQIYRDMDIGTAKATATERARVPHHLIDVVDPDQVLTLAEYQQMAYRTIAEIWSRDRLPFIVGGTGQYVAALLEGWRIPEVPPDLPLRAALEAEAGASGSEALHARLAAVDPVAAARIDYRNVRRVIRALEVCLVTGRPISELQAKSPPPFRALQMGVTRERGLLYERIDARVEHMIEDGLVTEVAGLAARGYSWDLPSMTGLGYRQIGQYLRGETALPEAIALIKKATRRFVQQQYNWFRLSDPAIRWFDPGKSSVDDALGYLSALIKG
jgi:tRNA dimethylallyltransferase